MQNNRYTIEQAKEIILQCYSDFYNGNATKISDWEFNELLDMVRIVEPDFDFKNSQEPIKVREITKITKNGKIKNDMKFCPICGSYKIKNNFCYNPTCKYWYEIIYTRLYNCLSLEERHLLKYAECTDFDSIKLVLTTSRINQILSDINNIRKIYNDNSLNSTNLDELPNYITIHLKHYLKLL